MGVVQVDAGAGWTVRVNWRLAVSAGLPLSVTVTVTVLLPAVAGVPRRPRWWG